MDMKQRLRLIWECEYMQMMRKRGEKLELRYRVMALSTGTKGRKDQKVAEVLHSKMVNFHENDRSIGYCLWCEWIEELMWM